MHQEDRRTMANSMVIMLSLLPTVLLAACSGANGTDSGGNPLDGGILSVTPLEPFSPSGPEGGPFAPTEKTYTISNIGATDLGWEVEISEAWLGLSESSGTLSAGDTIDLTLALDPTLAAALPDGMHTTLLTFRGAGTGGTIWDQTATVPGTLSVDFVFEGELAVYPPDPFQAFRPEGGPFLPNIKTYTLINVGGEPLD